jgi:hypothetical protein
MTNLIYQYPCHSNNYILYETLIHIYRAHSTKPVLSPLRQAMRGIVVIFQVFLEVAYNLLTYLVNNWAYAVLITSLEEQGIVVTTSTCIVVDFRLQFDPAPPGAKDPLLTHPIFPP